MKMSRTLIKTLSILIRGEGVAASSLRPDMAAELFSERLLTVHAKGSRRLLRAVDVKALRNFLSSRYEELRNLEDALSKGPDWSSRSEQAKESGNSKLVSVRSCPGFPVNCYEPIECSLAGKKIVLKPSEGSFQHIFDWRTFSLPPDVTIIGIENMENFIRIREQREFFDSCLSEHPDSGVPGRIIFVSRYPQSTDLRSWLQAIPNRYVHFGDFDLAGINIFLTEFYNHLGQRASFLVPDDIEMRLAHGSTVRYNSQYRKFHDLKAEDSRLQSLISLIHRYRRCYDQEGYIGS